MNIYLQSFIHNGIILYAIHTKFQPPTLVPILDLDIKYQPVWFIIENKLNIEMSRRMGLYCSTFIQN